MSFLIKIYCFVRQHGDLRKQLMSLQHELEEAVNQRQAALNNSETAQQDCKRQAEIAAQVRLRPITKRFKII